MEWTEDAIILGGRQHGETSVILEVMSRERGRHLGLVRGGRSRRLRPVLQPGNTVSATWRARLEDHLGQWSVEPVQERVGAMLDLPIAMLGLQTLTQHLRLLPERDPHPRLFDAATVIFDTLSQVPVAAELMALFELALLDELGFGLDLSTCAATGTKEDLIYVSPRSGRAVGRDAGAPYQKNLLPLPAFLHRRQPGAPPDVGQLADAFRTTGYFLRRNVYEPRGLAEPPVRGRFLAEIAAVLNSEPAGSDFQAAEVEKERG